MIEHTVKTFLVQPPFPDYDLIMTTSTTPRPGRRTAWLSAVVLVAVLAVTAFAARHWLRETWLIHRLGSEDKTVQHDAAAKLAELKSLRAVPRLVEMVGRDRGEKIEIFVTSRQRLVAYLRTVESRQVKALVGRPSPVQLVDAGGTVSLMPLGYALYSIGKRADPIVERMERNRCEDWEVVEVIRKLWANPRARVVRREGQQVPQIEVDRL